MKILEDLQSFKKYTTIRIMGYMLIKILKTKLHGLYVNEQKLLTVILIHLFLIFSTSINIISYSMISKLCLENFIDKIKF